MDGWEWANGRGEFLSSAWGEHFGVHPARFVDLEDRSSGTDHDGSSGGADRLGLFGT